jgi:choline monooxygenase
MYHGRRFNLDGTFVSMPEFSLTENFPRPCDDLHAFNLIEWGPFLFTSISPTFVFHQILSIMNERIGFLPLDEFIHNPSLGKDYLVNAHWALYCDNYLEGFHIPFVHQDLNSVLDYGQYNTELYDFCNVQIGYAKSGEECFTLPEGHPDYGKSIAAYYYWIFPNMMFNFYPWGLSINIVKPISIDKTKVSFITYVYDETKLHSGAGAMLDKVEREDEFVVENVFKGLKSRVYSTGRFSVNREQGTHHFHRLLAEFLRQNK